MKQKILIFAFLWVSFMASAQQIEDAWVFLVDKEDVANKIANPLTILTQKAIDRKNKHSVTIDARDVPVNESYITNLKNNSCDTRMLGYKLISELFVSFDVATIGLDNKNN